METCKDVIDLLSEYLEGDLAGAERRDFEAHMALCPACVEFLESLRATCSQVRTLVCDDLPDDVHAALRRFLDRDTKAR